MNYSILFFVFFRGFGRVENCRTHTFQKVFVLTKTIIIKFENLETIIGVKFVIFTLFPFPTTPLIKVYRNTSQSFSIEANRIHAQSEYSINLEGDAAIRI